MPPIATVEEETTEAATETQAEPGNGSEAPPPPAPEPAAPPAEEPIDRPTPAERLPGEESVDAHTWQLILSARSDEESALERVEECKLALREARGDFNAASKRLGTLIDESRTPGIFNQLPEKKREPRKSKEPKPEGAGTAAEAIKEGLDNAAAEKDKAAFDAATLGQLGIKAKLKENLEADGIRTGKDLAEWLNAVPRRKITGIGEDPDKGGLRKIVEAMEEFYLKRQREREGKTGPKLHDGRNSLVGPDAADPPSPEAVRNALLLVFPDDHPTPTREEIGKWTDAERVEVRAWAHAMRARPGTTPRIPPMPRVIWDSAPADWVQDGPVRDTAAPPAADPDLVPLSEAMGKTK